MTQIIKRRETINGIMMIDQPTMEKCNESVKNDEQHLFQVNEQEAIKMDREVTI